MTFVAHSPSRLNGSSLHPLAGAIIKNSLTSACWKVQQTSGITLSFFLLNLQSQPSSFCTFSSFCGLFSFMKTFLFIISLLVNLQVEIILKPHSGCKWKSFHAKPLPLFELLVLVKLCAWGNSHLKQ